MDYIWGLTSGDLICGTSTEHSAVLDLTIERLVYVDAQLLGAGWAQQALMNTVQTPVTGTKASLLLEALTTTREQIPEIYSSLPARDFYEGNSNTSKCTL